MLLEELTIYKEKLGQLFCGSDEVKELMIVKPDTNPRKLLYTQIFPYAYVPSVNTESNVYLCFDVEVPRINSNNNVALVMAVDIFIMSHENHMITDKGIRTDLLATEVNKLLNANMDFGFGLKLTSVRKFNHMEGYYGVELHFEANDFNNPNKPTNNSNVR